MDAEHKVEFEVGVLGISEHSINDVNRRLMPLNSVGCFRVRLMETNSEMLELFQGSGEGSFGTAADRGE